MPLGSLHPPGIIHIARRTKFSCMWKCEEGLFSFLRITAYSLTRECCVSHARANIHLNQLRYIFLSVCIGPTYQEGWARTRTGTTHQSARMAFSFCLPSRLINCLHATSPIYFSIGNRFSSASSPPLRLHLHPNPTAFTLF